LFGKMVAGWAQVAGEEMAAKTMPAGPQVHPASRRRPIPISAKVPTVSDLTASAAVLHLAVQPGFALEFSYQKALLNRAPSICSSATPAVKDIKIVQHSEVMNNKPPPRSKNRPMTPAGKSAISRAGRLPAFKKTIYKPP